MKRILITGASGFIGCHCIEPLKAQGYEVHAVSSREIVPSDDGVTWHQANLLDREQISPLLERIEPSHLLHLAWIVTPGESYASMLNFQWVQTVSSEKVARRLSEQRPDSLADLNVCLQVCTDGSGEHGGVMPEQLPALCDYVAALPGLQLRGLMTIPLPAETFEQQRVPFRLLKELFDEQCAAGHALDTLSMGMSTDLEAAIFEGSTMVRIGTALFGPRPG